MGGMVTVHHEKLGRSIEVDRIIGEHAGDPAGPLLVAVAGLHGNEPSGVFALKTVLDRLAAERPPFAGRLVGLAGNLTALGRGERFVDQDLNRAFLPDQLAAGQTVEQREAAAVLRAIGEAAEGFAGSRFLIDLHTTSSESQPYASVGCEAVSRAFGAALPVYIVHGLNAALRGTLVGRTVQDGWAGLTFEAGRHDDLSSVENQEACLWLSLAACGCLPPHAAEEYVEHARSLLARTTVEGRRVFEVAYRHAIKPADQFVMAAGFVNFQAVRKGELLGRDVNGEVRSGVDGRVLMPLYQKQGEDGFFLVREETPPAIKEPPPRAAL